MTERRRRAWAATGVALGLVIAGLALARDAFDWRVGGAASPLPTVSAGAGPDGRATTTGGPSPTTAPAAYRYLSTLPRSSGGFVTEVPRGLTDPTPSDRAIAIRCPGKGRIADVSFDLFGGYRDLTATVRPVFDVSTDVAVVTAFAVTQNPDDSVDKRTAGQVAVRAGAADRLAGEVVTAQQLVLQVRCPSADGVVVVDDGRLSRA
jgi:hypothetical protein